MVRGGVRVEGFQPFGLFRQFPRSISSPYVPYLYQCFWYFRYFPTFFFLPFVAHFLFLGYPIHPLLTFVTIVPCWGRWFTVLFLFRSELGFSPFLPFSPDAQHLLTQNATLRPSIQIMTYYLSTMRFNSPLVSIINHLSRNTYRKNPGVLKWSHFPMPPLMMGGLCTFLPDDTPSYQSFIIILAFLVGASPHIVWWLLGF